MLYLHHLHFISWQEWIYRPSRDVCRICSQPIFNPLVAMKSMFSISVVTVRIVFSTRSNMHNVRERDMD